MTTGTAVSHISAIHAGSLREQVSRALEAALVAGELQPGEIYSAPALAERFGSPRHRCARPCWTW